MTFLQLRPVRFANGGAAFARDDTGRPVFVRHAIPEETIRARITEDGERFAWADTQEVIEASPDRTTARCPHFGPCGGCHFQHMVYERQLLAKEEVVRDQLRRVGRLEGALIQSTIAHPEPWRYSREISLSPIEGERLGLWSPSLRQIMPIETCYLIDQELESLMKSVDLNLPELRKITLRLDEEGQALAALEVEGMEPPELEVDFPISVAIVLPDGRAASLIGDTYQTYEVKNRPFRVSPGCFFQTSPVAAGLLVENVLQLCDLTGKELVLEAYSGVGMLTAFLADQASEVIAIEVNEDAAADMAANLADISNVTLYQALVEEALSDLDLHVDLAVVDPGPRGLAKPVVHQLLNMGPKRLVYVSSDIATLSRDGRQLERSGYLLREIRPIDLRPQTYHVDSVSLWTKE